MQDDPRWPALLANARDGQWDPAREIDWSASPRAPWWLPRKAYVTLISQLYYGELASLRMCATLRPLLDGATPLALLDLQAADEARHALLYERFMGRLGEMAPQDDYVSTALEGGLNGRHGALGIMTAFHLVLEGEALVLQHDLAAQLPCPLFGRINALAARDEARHVAFGKSYLAGRYAELSDDERFALFVWARGLWHDCAQALRGRYSGISRAFLALSRGGMADRWQRQERALIEVGLVTADEARRL
jgi:hypothetical protein